VSFSLGELRLFNLRNKKISTNERFSSSEHISSRILKELKTEIKEQREKNILVFNLRVTNRNRPAQPFGFTLTFFHLFFPLRRDHCYSNGTTELIGLARGLDMSTADSSHTQSRYYIVVVSSALVRGSYLFMA